MVRRWAAVVTTRAFIKPRPVVANHNRDRPTFGRCPSRLYESLRASVVGILLIPTLAAFWTEACATAAEKAAGQTEPTTFTAADYARHVEAIKRRIAGDEFTIVVQPPFVVIGDEAPEVVKRRSLNTIKWAVDKLKEAYFTKDPEALIDIWLLKDDESYRQHCKSIFHKTPDTPYGYYSDIDRALVMNIATGGGTLVHEIVHPFVAANFPQCPAWFNEGLGSLYEQCDEENGQIHGLTNWRLAGLQEAIRQQRAPSFRALCSTTSDEFYRKDRGSNYSQARYLCYYLQEHGLLRQFYHAFQAHRDQDPTGYNTLKQVLGQDDMDAFQQQWEAWVLEQVYSSR
jgi:hypothetical protein